MTATRPLPRVARSAAPIVVAGGGVAIAVGPLLADGLAIVGSACGGGGNEQRCTGLARRLSLVEISPRAWLFVAAGVAIVLLAAATMIAIARNSPAAPIAMAAAILAVVTMAATERVGGKVDPAGVAGTVLREDWGPFLTPELTDMRTDALRKYAGRSTEPGGPVYDPEQILSSFSVREQAGWSLLSDGAAVVLFASLFAFASILVGSFPLAATMAGTAGLAAWALSYDAAFECDPGASECYDGLLTMLALILVGAWWAVYVVGRVVAKRLVRGR